MTQVVGVVGLGIMGGAIARNMVKNGMKVVGYDPTASAAERLRDSGGTPLASIEEVVKVSSVILTSLPTVDVFRSATLAIAAAEPQGRIVIEVSTMPLADKEQARAALEQAGCVLLDCPISGTGAQADTQDLVIFGSGVTEAYDAVKVVLEGFSRKQIYLGAFGNGTKMKFIANHLVGIHNAAAAEAFTLAGKAGIDLQTVFDALQDSAGTSRMFQLRGPLMVKGAYSPPTARISMFLKDLDVIGEFAANLRCPTPLFSATTQLYYAALNQGLAESDTAAVCKVLEDAAGVHRN
jgi:putative dehydrogenase